jgi:hypothetical protein
MAICQSDMFVAASVRTFNLSQGALIGPLHSCLGIDFQAARQTPCNELIRVDYGANNDVSGSLQFALACLGLLQPLVIRGGEIVRVFHNLEDANIGLAAVPTHSNGARDVRAIPDLPLPLTPTKELLRLLLKRLRLHQSADR